MAGNKTWHVSPNVLVIKHTLLTQNIIAVNVKKAFGQFQDISIENSTVGLNGLRFTDISITFKCQYRR